MADTIFRDNSKRLRDMLPQYTDARDGITGQVQADGSYAFADTGLDAPYTWVTLDGNRSATRCVSPFNRHAAGIGVHTAINERTGEREIRDFTLKTLQDYSETVIDKVKNPGGGVVHETDILPGKIEPDTERGGLWIRARYFVMQGGVTFPPLAEDASYDLSTEVAALSSSMSAMALIYADPDDGALHVEVGDERGLAYPYSAADADAIALPDGVYPLAGLVLFDGQTDAEDSFAEYVRYFDRRIFLDSNAASSAASVILAPASSTRNAIQPSGDFIGLVLKNHASQSVNIFEHHDDDGTVLAFLSADGDFTAVTLNAYSTAAVATLLNLTGDGGTADGILTSYNANSAANSTQITQQRARGTLASPAAIQVNDRMGQFLWGGWDGATFPVSVALIASVFDTVGTNSVPGRILLQAIRAAGDTTRTEYWRVQGGEFVINEGSADIDFRVESDGNTALLFTDASTDRVGIGTNAPATQFHALLSDSATNAVVNVATLGHNGGSVAAGFGGGIAMQLESSTTNAQDAAAIEWLWQTATHASRAADLVLSAYNTTNKREGLRIRGGASGAELGFYGVAPIARALLATGAGATVDNVITALQNLGLVRQS